MPDWIAVALLGVVVVNLIGTLAMWVHLDRNADGVHKLATRVSVLERSFADMPGHRDLAGINRAISQLSSEVAAMRERTDISSLTLLSIKKHLENTP